MTYRSGEELKREYERKILNRLAEDDLLDLEGKFDFDYDRRFPYIKVNKKLANILFPLMKKEGFRIRPWVKYNYKAGKFLKTKF